MEEKATITFKRETSWGYSNFHIKHYILIDGAVAGTIENQETKVIEVTPGTHVVEILQDPLISLTYIKNISRSTLKIMEVKPGENSLCEIVTPSRLTTVLASMFVLPIVFTLVSNQMSLLLKKLDVYFEGSTRFFEDQLFNLGLNWNHVNIIKGILSVFPILLIIWILIQILTFGIFASKTIFKEDMFQFPSKK